MTETELGAAGIAEAKAGERGESGVGGRMEWTVAKDRLTSGQTASASGQQKRPCRSGARGAGSEDGK